LGAGFGLGGGEEKETDGGDVYRSGLWGYAQSMGVELTQEEAAESVRIYREMYPEVVQLWWDMQDAAVEAIRHPKQIFEVGPVAFECAGAKVLRMLLPSGRCLHYINPRADMVEREGRHGTYKKAQVTYEGREQGTRAWNRQNLIGSHACENAVQAIARDILVYGMRLATEIGFKIVLHVHDEIGALVKDGSHLGLDDLVRCMSTQPPWTGGNLPLEAAGYENIFYRKG
jgi:DNA polymerase